jgi:DNA-binding protein Fis
MTLGGEKLKPFGLFTQTPIDICLLATAIFDFLVFGRFVLPAGKGEADRGVTAALMEEYKAQGNTFEIRLPEGFDGPKTLEELNIRSKFLATVVGIHHAGKKGFNLTPRSNNEIQAFDTIAVMGKEKNIHKMVAELGWTLKEGLDIFAESLARTSAGMALLCCHSWPGNVRELENVIERGVALTIGKTIMAGDLPDYLNNLSNETYRQSGESIPILNEQEKRYIVRVLEKCKGDKTRAAAAMGIDRVSLWRKLKRFHIE